MKSIMCSDAWPHITTRLCSWVSLAVVVWMLCILTIVSIFTPSYNVNCSSNNNEKDVIVEKFGLCKGVRCANVCKQEGAMPGASQWHKLIWWNGGDIALCVFFLIIFLSIIGSEQCIVHISSENLHWIRDFPRFFVKRNKRCTSQLVHGNWWCNNTQ